MLFDVMISSRWQSMNQVWCKYDDGILSSRLETVFMKTTEFGEVLLNRRSR